MRDFLNFYDLETKLVLTEARRSQQPKSKAGRKICRFCNGIDGQFGVSFNKKAHTISKALGNQNILSDDECDDCNRKFCTYENELIRYIEIRRVLYNVDKKFMSCEDSEFKIVPYADINKAVKISDNTQDLIHTSTLDDGSIIITASTHPYKPIMVYRSLLKYALAIIDKKYLDDYRLTYKMLLDEELNNSLRTVSRICQHTLFNMQLKTCCSIFKRKDNTHPIPNHMVLFSYKDVMFQFFLPYSKADYNLYRGNPFTLKLLSPEIFGDKSRIVKYNRNIVDLSGVEKTEHTEKFVMSFDENSSKNFGEKSPFKNFPNQELFSDLVSSQILLVPFESD